MMMGGDKKKIAAIILAGVKPKTEFDSMKEKNAEGFDKMASPSPDKKGVSEGLLSASEEMMGALQAKNPQAFASALKDFITIMEDGEDEDEESEDENAEK